MQFARRWLAGAGTEEAETSVACIMPHDAISRIARFGILYRSATFFATDRLNQLR
jgi:hypothetical protein